MYLNPYLKTVPAAEREAFSQLCEQRTFRRKEVVLEAGTWVPYGVCVGSGLLRLEVQGSDGAGVTTEFLRQHEIFWEYSERRFFYQSSVTLVAALPTHVFLVPLEALNRLVERHPSVVRAMAAQLINHLQQLRTQFRRVTTRSPEDVVARILHELTELAPAGDGVYDKRITQAVIASYAGLSREQVNKTMRELEARGLLKREDAGMRVPPSFGSTTPGELMDFEDTRPGQEPAAAPPMLDFPDAFGPDSGWPKPPGGKK